MRPGPVLLLVWAAVAAPAAEAAHRKSNNLLRVVTPAERGTLAAHPFVNIEVGFGNAANGAPADPTTFRARLGHVDITTLFRPFTRNGATLWRAEAGPALLRVGGHRTNRLRLEVSTAPTKRGRRIRDIDRVRFRATDAADQAPLASLGSPSPVILPGIPLAFDATGSSDPEDDAVTYSWDFGDGTTSNEPQPRHTYGSVTSDVTVRLTVSDGQLAGSDQTRLLAIPPLDPGRTPGKLSIQAAAPLEFGVVTPGASAALTFTVKNTDDVPTSQLRVRLGLAGAGFILAPTVLDLAAGESAPVTLTFTPGADASGHQRGDVSLVASASNLPAARLLAHAFGGAAPPGTGPIPAASALYYAVLGTNTFGIAPSGARFTADSTIHLCQTTQDYCLTDADCAANGGSCLQSGSCVGGGNAGQACTSPNDCPDGFCTASLSFDPLDMCGDGQGGLYLLSDENTFTDPNDNRETALSGTLMRAEFDGSGARTDAAILTRVDEGTAHIGCDAVPASAGGFVYMAEFHNVNSPPNCFRDGREALTSVRKSTGAEAVLISRIDAAEGLGDCDDVDQVDALEVTPDGSSAFVAFPGFGPGTGGIYRIRPSALQMTPDIDDVIQVHPDGSVVFVTATDQGTTAFLRIYKLSPDQAAHGAQLVRDLTPCATIEVPNNNPPGANNRVTGISSFAVDHGTPGSFDATVLVSFFGGGGGSVVGQSLLPRGTFAVASPGGSNTCTLLGLVNLDLFDQMTF